MEKLRLLRAERMTGLAIAGLAGAGISILRLILHDGDVRAVREMSHLAFRLILVTRKPVHGEGARRITFERVTFQATPGRFRSNEFAEETIGNPLPSCCGRSFVLSDIRRQQVDPRLEQRVGMA